MKNINLLLISNSVSGGGEYLAWTRPFISEFITEHKIKTVLFIPWAGVNLDPVSLERSFDVYIEKVGKFFSGLDITVQSIHYETDPVKAVRNAQAIVVGGGNTFHLVRMMHETGIMAAIREKVLSGIPYIGWSAGANVACPTLRTTNDMPISEPSSFECLNLVPFQINPHYLDTHHSGHGGETREQRIMEFLTVNRNITVAGLREGSLLHVKGNTIQLKGTSRMRLFRFGEDPREFEPGDIIDFLLPQSRRDAEK
jgi:dipeptidase E